MSSIFPIREKVSLDREPEPRLVDLDEETADEVFEALASSTTRKIFLELHNQPQTASDLAEVTETSVQNVQYHLEKLEDVDLVEVVDTWYSERGSEMKVYAPEDESLVLFAGRDKQSAFRRLLNRFAGLFAVLLPPSILAGWLAGRDDSSIEEEFQSAQAGDNAESSSSGGSDGADGADGADGGGDVGITSTNVEEEASDAADGGISGGGETPVSDATEIPKEEYTMKTMDGLDSGTDNITIPTDVDIVASHNDTLYLVADNGSSDIFGIDPQIALAFFVGGLVVYAAFVLRRRVI
ncbi:ArsR/SmtB family transcription factor [Halovenus rubra]|uniref:ArsR/SmtB family transcription factor n=2 Tax=Halovenus rubra TaxID=869890 RepID=A0ACC7DWN6_9EURY|nr:helix-turn-helix domain-containing protein [Halovenus rubra]